MKICLISFDYWGYDQYIVKALKALGHDAYHLDNSNFQFYNSLRHRLQCGLIKLLKNKNLKKEAFQQQPIDFLKKHGPFDQVLIVRADLYSIETHRKIKALCNRYIAYVYDSAKRFSLNTDLTNGIFDRVYSYDPVDAKEQGWQYQPNFIYLEKQQPTQENRYDCCIIMSCDERLEILNILAERLNTLKLRVKFIVVGKKPTKRLHPLIEFSKTDISIEKTLEYMRNSKVILDLVRKDHSGLSFRVFEAAAMQKKLITSNTSIKNLALFNPKNIFVLTNNFDDLELAFFNESYQPIDDTVYQKYTISSWVRAVFEL